MTRLYLVRHGETVDNARLVMQGQTQGLLNATGEEQARQLATQLVGIHFDVFLSSDLHRAIQTARILALPHRKEILTTPLLRERDWGDFTGRYIPDLKNVDWPQNVESLPHLLSRARQFLAFVATNFPGQTVLAVGHGIINKAIQAEFFHKKMREVERMRNAEIRILDIPS